MSPRIFLPLLGSLLIASGSAFAAPLVAVPAAQAIEVSDSAMTKSGTGEFTGLEVTVSQTEGLVNQIVEVTWRGGKPTNPAFGNLNTNYLQIMQCWGGTPDEGPPREQCQYGSNRSSTGGQNTASRQMTTAGVIDPLEDKYEEYREGTLSYIPFRSVTGKVTRGNSSEFFDRNTSNESNHNRTRADGTGEDFFEIQTGVEAPGLGCGQVRNGETPLCWLVVVPRGSTEVDGQERGLLYRDPLDTSPLMASNWANRIVFPLQFQPIGVNCSINAQEIPLLGSDRIAEAITRWQPALCVDVGSNFSYTVLADSAARAKLTSESSDMVFLNYGVGEDEADPQRPITYAPVAISGLTIAFNVQSQSSTLADPAVRARDGERIQDIKLTPRLVAKLLTQTYRYDAVPNQEKVADNPFDITQDPDFLELNPRFADLKFPGLGHTLTTIGQSDSARLVWEWIWGDREARAFLRGKPDPWGTVVNPDYRRAEFPRSDYPRTDNSCITYSDRVVPVCTFDLFPYAGDLSAAARAASRGDTLARGNYDPAALPPGYKRSPLQEPGRRAMIVITDTPLTDRFALTPAALRNADGQFVLPEPQALRIAADAAVQTGVPGVVQPDPARKVKGAYPLTSFTYAATTPATLSEDEAQAYSALLSYAATKGQQIGDEIGRLPFGYIPLTDAEVKKIERAAIEVVDTAGVVLPAPDPEPEPEPEPEPGTDLGAGSGGGIPFGGGGSSTPISSGGSGSGVSDSSGQSAAEASEDSTEPTVDAATEAAVEETTEPTDPVVAEAAIETLPTPAAPVGSIRYVAVILLIAGGLALLIAALLGRVVGRRT